MNVLERLLGPLAAEECRRAVRRSWLWWARLGAAVVATGTVVAVLWFWWMAVRYQPGFLPGELLAGATFAVEGMAVTLALLLGPALVAGAIASEKDRGTLELLLISRLSAGEIVAARFLGLLSQVAMIGVAGLPAIVILAATRGAPLAELVLLVLLPASVALGSGGLALAASTLSRKARDALLAVYLLEIAALVANLWLTSWTGNQSATWRLLLNPYAALPGLIEESDFWSATLVVIFWSALGLAGLAAAAWQLWPAYLRHIGGGKTGQRKTRRHRVPPVSDRPVLWKELFIDRGGVFGWIGRWLGRLLFALLAAASIFVLVATIVRPPQGPATRGFLFGYADHDWLTNWRDGVATMIAGTAMFVRWLLQWAIGLRASAAVATERQRATWDALLVSPLDGREILWGKTWGSMHALRWLVAVAILSWIVAAIAGEMPVLICLESVGLLLFGGAFMAAAGTAISIGTQNTARSMAMTLGMWMLATTGTMMCAGAGAGALLVFAESARAMLTLLTHTPYLSPTGRPMSLFDYFPLLYGIIRLGCYALATAAIGVHLRTQFDRLAGRLPDTTRFIIAERVTHAPDDSSQGGDGTLLVESSAVATAPVAHDDAGRTP